MILSHFRKHGVRGSLRPFFCELHPRFSITIVKNRLLLNRYPDNLAFRGTTIVDSRAGYIALSINLPLSQLESHYAPRLKKGVAAICTLQP